jgi:hypothetical protein
MSSIGFCEDLFNKIFIPELSPSGWEMTPSEKLIFLSVVGITRPIVALEVGSRAGGSLQVLSRACKKVFCIDLDLSVPERLGSLYRNVEFRIGDSKSILANTYAELIQKGEFPNFIHLDGDHSEEGAYLDLLNTLSISPPHRTIVLMHDTFNPVVRAGVLRAIKQQHKYLHYADLDFTPGVLHERPAVKDEMWGGFSLFILDPAPVETKPIINSYLERMINAVARISAHPSVGQSPG